MKISFNNLGCAILAFYLLAPTKVVPGDVFGVIILSNILFLMVLLTWQKKIDIFLIFLTLQYMLVIGASMALNPGSLSFSDIFELGRPMQGLIIFSFFMNCGAGAKGRVLFYLLALFIIFELLIVLAQRNDISSVVAIISNIWNIEKNWILRNTGTFSNPNILGIYAISVVFLLRFWLRGPVGFSFYWLLGFLIVLLTGSRTSLAAMAVISLLVIMIEGNHRAISYVKRIIGMALFSVIFVSSILLFVEEDSYMGQILVLINSGDLGSVNSFAQRYSLWEYVTNLFFENSFLQFLFGLGPQKEAGLRYIDNEYLAVLVKYGLIGVISTSLWFLYPLYLALKSGQDAVKVVLPQTVLVIIFGLTAETISSWQLAFFYFLSCGLAISWSENNARSNASMTYRKENIHPSWSG